MNTREPIFFKEEVQFYRESKEGEFKTAVKQPSDCDIVVDLLAEMDDVYPMGYPTEQFICRLKNDIIQSFIKLKEDRRKAVFEMRRQMFEDGAKIKVERPPEIQRDPGLLAAQGFHYEEFFTMVDTVKKVNIPSLLRVQDNAYNDMRIKFKDVTDFVIRPYFANPSKAALAGKE